MVDHLHSDAARVGAVEWTGGVAVEAGPRPYRTRRNSFAGFWAEDVVPLLQAAPGLRPITLLAELAQYHPRRVGASLGRPLERRVARWKVLYGPDREVISPKPSSPAA